MRKRRIILPRTEWLAQVARWNVDKGYGWLRWADKEVFFHIRDYEGPDRLPKVGEEVKFVLATDQQGRARAIRVLPVKNGPAMGLLQWPLLAVLLILPAAALYKHQELGKWAWQ